MDADIPAKGVVISQIDIVIADIVEAGVSVLVTLSGFASVSLRGCNDETGASGVIVPVQILLQPIVSLIRYRLILQMNMLIPGNRFSVQPLERNHNLHILPSLRNVNVEVIILFAVVPLLNRHFPIL